MSTTLQIATRREARPRVLPRRRGETAPTTLDVASESAAALSAAPPSFPPVHIRKPTGVTTSPANPPRERVNREFLADARVKQSFENLADAILQNARPAISHVVAGYASQPGTTVADSLGCLSHLLSQRRLGRVQLLSGDARFFELAEKLQTPGISASESREIRQAIRTRMAELRGTCKFILCDAGPAHGPLASLVGPLCDSGYLFVELGRTDPAVARQVLTSLRRRGAGVLGCIVVE
jgi:hypothetical protein